MIPPKPADAPAPPPAPAPTGPRLSRRAVLLLAAWTVVVAGVSSGVTVALVGDDSSPDAMPATESSASPWQDTRTYPEDAGRETEGQPSASPTVESHAMGKKVRSGGATVVVEKVRESPTVVIDDFDGTKTLKASEGAKYVTVETTVYNDGDESFDPVCGGGISQGLVDAEGRTFDVIENVYQIKENQKAKACGEEVQPGFKRDAHFVYRIPADAKPALWKFSGSQGADDDLALVKIAGSVSR
ncbi:DUF4352 domain-containing protein [Streptomyces sp. JNUCC 64]